MNDRRNSLVVPSTGALVHRATVAWQRGMLAGAALLALVATSLALAQAAPEDLPGRVGRIADVTGELFIAPQDRPDAWQPVGINYPVTSGDNLWLGSEGRAEVDFGGGQFRFAGDTSIHVSQLDDHRFSIFVAQGRVSVRVRGLEPGDVATIDTPNAQVAITRPGLYRLEVTEDRQHSVLIVREGEANVLTQAAVQQVLPGQAAYVDGTDPQYANVQNGIGLDGFDSWVASRDRLYRVRGNNYVSPQMVGAADLDQYGTWTQAPEYGAVWYPNDVPSDWAPYRNGYWVDVGTWGPTWVDNAPWGYAPFHYGRWAFIGGRWGWCPGAYTARPLWAPALVAWTGGAGWSVSVTAGGPVYGWVPLSWGEPFRPWWGRCSTGCWDRFNRPYAVNVAVVRPWSPPPQRWRNASAPGGVTAVPFQAFQSRQPVQQNLVRVPRDVVAAAPALAMPPVMRSDPNRSFAQRPGSAPPPASSFQPAIARQAPAAGATPLQRGGPVQGDTSVNRGRPGMPATAAPGTPAAAPGVARPVAPGVAQGNPFAPTQPGGRTTAVPGQAQPTQSVPVPGTAGRDGRPQMGSPQSPAAVPGQPLAAQPVMRGQPQQGIPSAQPSQQPTQPAQPTMRGQPQQAGAQPQQPGAQPPQPVMRGQPPPQSAPQVTQPSQPVMRAQPQPMPQAPSQPVMRAQPQPQPQAAQPVARPQPQMAAPQPAPQQPVMRGQPQQAAPQPAPAQRAAPQPAPAPAAQPEQGRQGGGGDGGAITRGERGR